MIPLIASALVLAPFVQSAKFVPGTPAPRFPIGTYDEFGFVSWKDLGQLDRVTREGLDLLQQKGREATAFGYFRRVLPKDPDNLTLIQGYFMAAYRNGRLHDVLNEVIDAFGAAPVKVNQNRPVWQVSSQLRLALIYGHGLVHYYEDRGLLKRNELTQQRMFWVQRCQAELQGYVPQDRASGIMHLTALRNLNETAAARDAARALLARWPDWYQIRLVLWNLYSEGTVAIRDEHGKSIPVPEDERRRSDLAAIEAEKVITSHPEVKVAYYYAGVSSVGSNPAKAKKYFEYFLKTEDPSTMRYAFASWAVGRPKK